MDKINKTFLKKIASETLAPFTIRSNGGVGQEILDADGRIVCWTTDEWIARVICKLLTENDGLLARPGDAEVPGDEVANDQEEQAMIAYLKAHDRKYTDIVRDIIEKNLLQKGGCSKYYVLERIKTMVRPTELHNKALIARGHECGDGIKNMQDGAKAIYRESMRALGRLFRVTRDGRIEHRRKDKALDAEEMRS